MNTKNNSKDYDYNSFKMLKIHFLTELQLNKMKFILIPILLIIMGLFSVVSMVLLPDILSLSGIEITGLPDPDIIMVLADYWDITIYAIVFILIGMTAFSSELDLNKQGYFYLARPISRTQYYLSRTVILIAVVIIGVMFGSIITYIYATIFFDPLDIIKLLIAAFLVASSLGVVMTIVIMFSTRFNALISGMASFLVLFVLLLLTIIGPLEMINPIAMSSIWIDVLTTEVELIDLLVRVLGIWLWIIGPLLIGLIMYNKRDL